MAPTSGRSPSAAVPVAAKEGQGVIRGGRGDSLGRFAAEGGQRLDRLPNEGGLVAGPGSACRSLIRAVSLHKESVGRDGAGGGYCTLSEERQGIPAYLYHYPRLEASAD